MRFITEACPRSNKTVSLFISAVVLIFVWSPYWQMIEFYERNGGNCKDGRSFFARTWALGSVMLAGTASSACIAM